MNEARKKLICQRCRERLGELLPGHEAVAEDAVSPELAEARAHLENCAACRRELELMEVVRGLIRTMPAQSAPEELRNRIRVQVERKNAPVVAAAPPPEPEKTVETETDEPVVPLYPAPPAPPPYDGSEPQGLPNVVQFILRPANTVWALSFSAVLACIVILLVKPQKPVIDQPVAEPEATTETVTNNVPVTNKGAAPAKGLSQKGKATLPGQPTPIPAPGAAFSLNFPRLFPGAFSTPTPEETPSPTTPFPGDFPETSPPPQPSATVLPATITAGPPRPLVASAPPKPPVLSSIIPGVPKITLAQGGVPATSAANSSANPGLSLVPWNISGNARVTPPSAQKRSIDRDIFARSELGRTSLFRAPQIAPSTSMTGANPSTAVAGLPDKKRTPRAKENNDSAPAVIRWRQNTNREAVAVTKPALSPRVPAVDTSSTVYVTRTITTTIRPPKDMNWGQVNVVLYGLARFPDGAKSRVFWSGAAYGGEDIEIQFSATAPRGVYTARLVLQELKGGEANTLGGKSVVVNLK